MCSSKRYNMKFVEVDKTSGQAERKESSPSVVESDFDESRDELEEFSEDFAETLEDIDFNDLLARHILDHPSYDNDTGSTTSSKGTT